MGPGGPVSLRGTADTDGLSDTPMILMATCGCRHGSVREPLVLPIVADHARARLSVQLLGLVPSPVSKTAETHCEDRGNSQWDQHGPVRCLAKLLRKESEGSSCARPPKPSRAYIRLTVFTWYGSLWKHGCK